MDFGEGDGVFAGAADLLEGDALVAEVALGEFVHAVAASDAFLAAPRVEREAHHHGVVDGADGDAVLGEHVEVIFGVLADL